MAKRQNLLLVTEHYPCGVQESFLEMEIEYLTRLYNVHVVTTDTDRLMTRALPRGVTFSRPAEHTGTLRRGLARLQCLVSRGYMEERKRAKAAGRWNREFRAHMLDVLVSSRLMYNYIRTLDIFQDERPLTIYSANMNNYLYGLCCLKQFSESTIRVVARCHRANMRDPITGKRRDTLNHMINESIDALYFTNEARRQIYLRDFAAGEPAEVKNKLQVMPLGVPGPLKKDRPKPDEFLLRVLSCSPIEPDKRLDLLIDGIAGMEHGCLEWIHIGDGSDRERILHMAADKLGDKPGIRYRFLGRMSQQELYQWYQDTPVDVLLSVSKSESVPVAMLTAMAHHVVVCATAVDGVTDVVNNENGMLLPPDPTASQLSRFLEALCMMSKEPFAEKAEVAYQCWRDHFNADRNCVDLVSSFRSLYRDVEEDQPEEDEQAESEKTAQPASPFLTHIAHMPTREKLFPAAEDKEAEPEPMPSEPESDDEDVEMETGETGSEQDAPQEELVDDALQSLEKLLEQADSDRTS